MKKFLVSLILGICVFSLFAQRRAETTAEEEYLNASAEILIAILASQDDLESKEDALNEARKLIESGQATPGIRVTLERLAGEGTKLESRTNGRLVNNYFDVRKQACELLAQIPTRESKEALKLVLAVDNEPSILAAAVRGLAEIGMNDNDDVTAALLWVLKKNESANASSTLAAAVIEAFEKLAPSIQNPENRKEVINAVASVSGNWRYNKDVRNNAKLLHKELRGASK